MAVVAGRLALPDIGELIVSDMAIAPRQRFIAASPLVDRVSDEEDVALIMKGLTQRFIFMGMHYR